MNEEKKKWFKNFVYSREMRLMIVFFIFCTFFSLGEFKAKIEIIHKIDQKVGYGTNPIEIKIDTKRY